MEYKKHITINDIDKLFDLMVDDYYSWLSRCNNLPQPADYAQRSTERFKSNLSVKMGAKYIKLVSGNSAVGFVVNTHDDSKFEFGDLLKASSWNAPARNFARGNIFDKNIKITRTGIR